MKSILAEIENYGYTTEKLNTEVYEGYVCNNSLTGIRFVLDNSQENYMKFDEIKGHYAELGEKDQPVVYLIPVPEDAGNLISLIESGHMEGHNILMWDKEDELEFFLKDLWDILFKMGTVNS